MSWKLIGRFTHIKHDGDYLMSVVPDDDKWEWRLLHSKNVLASESGYDTKEDAQDAVMKQLTKYRELE